MSVLFTSCCARPTARVNADFESDFAVLRPILYQSVRQIVDEHALAADGRWPVISRDRSKSLYDAFSRVEPDVFYVAVEYISAL